MSTRIANCMAEHAGILDAMAKIALNESGSGDDEHIQNCVIAAIESISTVESTRQILADNEGVTEALNHTILAVGNEDRLFEEKHDWEEVTSSGAVLTYTLARRARRNLEKYS